MPASSENSVVKAATKQVLSHFLKPTATSHVLPGGAKIRKLLSLGSVAVVTAVLFGCATAPLNTNEVSVQLTPEQILSEPDAAKGTVIWGGVIVSSTNLVDRTQFEVLAYPLDRQQRPLTHRKSLGRFLLQSPDYIETQNYSPGRELTAIGTLQGVTKGEIGEASYVYPTVTINDVHLWHPDNSHEKPRFIFGIGLNIGG